MNLQERQYLFGGVKILHLATDDKFIDQAFFVFEETFPDKNHVVIFSKTEELKYVKTCPKKVVKKKNPFIKAPKISSDFYKKYDLVVFHSFGDPVYPEIYNIPEGIPTIWLGWGFDYYDLVGDPERLLLPETKRFAKGSIEAIFKRIIKRSLVFGFRFIGMVKEKKEAIEKVSIFSPVLPSEYALVINSCSWERFPFFSRWNYGTIEDHFIKGFEGESVKGSAILVGNSASATCNHIEIFKWLQKEEVDKREIVAPLSYGEKKYGERISKFGRECFGVNFKPLENFLPVQEYVEIIKKCGYVIMNHKRQQAIGNIVIMLYLGARVFLREENPAYSFFKEMGVKISSIQELEESRDLLETPLSIDDKINNRQLVCGYWSRDRAVSSTKELVQQALERIE